MKFLNFLVILEFHEVFWFNNTFCKYFVRLVNQNFGNMKNLKAPKNCKNLNIIYKNSFSTTFGLMIFMVLRYKISMNKINDKIKNLKLFCYIFLNLITVFSLIYDVNIDKILLISGKSTAKKLVLVGMMGSGKTTVAKRLAYPKI